MGKHPLDEITEEDYMYFIHCITLIQVMLKTF
jgi:hypothetical protein